MTQTPNNTVIETVEQESTDLDLHVQLCAYRYNELHNRLDKLDKKVDQLADLVIKANNNIKAALITTCGTVLVAIVGAIALYLTK